jgi:site-specific DNA-methyltransferase (adenine-specific)
MSINIINCDCIEGIRNLEDNSLDLVVTSPPYNVDLGNNKFNKTAYDLHDDNLNYDYYLNWLEAVFYNLYLKLKIGGRVCINIGDGKNGSVPTSSDTIQFMKHIGYLPYTHIIWDKSQVGSRTAWGSFNSPSCPSFPTPFEHILVFYKLEKKLQTKGETDLKKEEFIDWSLALWKFTSEINQKKLGHPAMFPEELPKRLIKMFSWIGANVCDPFSGLGTTAVVCKKLNRNFIGFEISEDYVKKSLERLSKVEV